MLGGSVYGGDKDLYDFLWLDPDKKVYVLQNKIYEKKGKHYFTLGLGKGLSADFQSTYLTNVKYGYYFAEEWGVELLYSNKTHENDDAYKTIADSSGGNNKLPFVRRFNSYYGVMGVWSPFYGKINTFNKIYYFDFSFGLGISKIDAESNRTAFQANSNNDLYEKEDYIGVMSKAQMRLYFNESWSTDLEYLNHSYKANSGLNDTEKIRNNADLILSIGYSF